MFSSDGIKSASKAVNLRLRVKTPWLGERRAKDIRQFDISKIGDKTYLFLDLVRWRWAIKEALDCMGILKDTDIDYIGLPATIPAPAIRMYKRRWDNKNPQHQEMFQCIQANTIITIPITILSSLPDNPMAAALGTRPPTEEELIRCFAIIGESIGLSPFGSRFGYGRFDVEQGKPQNDDNSDS